MSAVLPAPPAPAARVRPLPLPASGAAHVFFASLEQPPRWTDSPLSPDERERAARFHFTRDRDRFVAGRALLRQLLGRYLGCAAREVVFEYDPNGKPRLAGAHALTFNVSHSHAAAVFAFARGRELGVDIERLPAPDDGDSVARHFFAPAEVAVLNSLPARERASAFLRCWTRKEAYIKARGDGLSLPLDSFEVSLAPGAPPALLATRHDPAAVARWRLVDLSSHCPGHLAALAIEGGDPTLTIAHI